MKSLPKLIASLLFIALICAWAFFVSACGYAEHKDPPIYTFDSIKLVAESARLHARDIDGYSTLPNECCGSMKPLIREGDVLVIRPVPLTDDMLGRVAFYRPKWAKGKGVVHRLVAKDSAGYIASGDNNARSEPDERVTSANFNGEVVAIYRIKP